MRLVESGAMAESTTGWFGVLRPRKMAPNWRRVELQAVSLGTSQEPRRACPLVSILVVLGCIWPNEQGVDRSKP